MTVVRLEQQKTDIVVTVNVPFSSPNLVRNEGTVASPVYSGELNGARGQLLAAAVLVRDSFLSTLTVLDWDLFVPE